MKDTQGPAELAANQKPLVSIVIPLYNAEKWICEAIRSVLAQTYGNWELIVIDDGSTDGGVEAALECVGHETRRLKIISTTNLGQAKARNRGIDESSGDLIAFLDSDDIWHPCKLQIQIESLTQANGCVGVGCDYEIFSDSDRKSKGIVQARWSIKMVRRWIAFEGFGALLPSTVILKKDIVNKLSGFNENLELSTDLDFAYRLVRLGSVASVARPLVFYRHRAGQMHRDYDLLRRDYSHLLSQDSFENEPDFVDRVRANLEILVAIHQAIDKDWRLAAKSFRQAVMISPPSLLILPLYLMQRVSLRKVRGFWWMIRNNRRALSPYIIDIR